MDWRTGWTYRVGVELAEAHFAGLFGFKGCVSVPSLAVCMVLELVVVLSWWGVREDVSFALRRGELSSLKARGGVQSNSAAAGTCFPARRLALADMELLPTTTTTTTATTSPYTARITCGQRLPWSLL